MVLGGILSYYGTRSTNETTGEVQHVALSPSQEIALGLEAAPSMAAKFGGESAASAFAVATYDPDHPRTSQEAAAVAAAVGQLVNLKYGRSDELEADAIGVRFMRSAGYDPTGMLDVMKVLASLGGAREPEFFSTHPN